MDDHRTSHDRSPEAPGRWFRRAAPSPERRAPAAPPQRRAVPGGDRNETAEMVSRAIRWTYR